MKKVFDLEERLLEYAARIIRLVEALPDTRAGNHVGNQLLRSGTSPLPNHGEAQAAESRADFVHKMGICLKELRETCRWLLLCRRVPLVRPSSALDPIIIETDELVAIFVSSLKTARKRKS
jgi:four helix bundle protein